MQINRYQLREGKISFLTLFTAGVFAGMVFVNLRKSIWLDNTGLLDEYTLYHMKDMAVDNSALFYYVLRQRVGQLLVLAVLSTTYLGLAACSAMALWYGVCAGAFLATAVLRYGMKGIFLVLTGIFPQYLLYIPAMIALLYWCRYVYRMIYLDRTYGGDVEKRFLLPKCLLQLLGILAVFVVGCVLESFLNPFLLKGFLKIF